jgi:hypothetical protein
MSASARDERGKPAAGAWGDDLFDVNAALQSALYEERRDR